MNHDETVAAVARKLYRFTQKDVSEMLEVLIEIWQEHLLQPEAVIQIKGLGKLRINEQELPTSQAVSRFLQERNKSIPPTLKRYYFRFTPTDAYKQRLIETRRETDE